MTFDDDMLQLEFDHGVKRVLCKPNGIDWPPAEVIEIFGFRMRRESMSIISDEDRADMTHVCRGAVYRPWKP